MRTKNPTITIHNESGALLTTSTGYFRFTVTNPNEFSLLRVTIYFTVPDPSDSSKPAKRIFVIPESNSVDYISGGGSWTGTVMVRFNGPDAGPYNLQASAYYDVERTASNAIGQSMPLQVVEGSGSFVK